MQPVFAVMYREFLIRRTSPTWMFFDMVLPLMYLLMFGVGLDRAIGLGMQIDGRAISYNEFFLAGVLAMSCFGSAINQSYGFFIDRDNGIFYEFLTYPMTRSQLMVGKIVFQCLMSIVQCLLTLGMGAWLLDIVLLWEFVAVVVAIVILGIAAWFFFMATFAFLIHRNDTYNTVINALYFVLMFGSSLFYPLQNVPEWLQKIAMVNPLTWHTDMLRYFTVGIGNFSTIAFEFAGFALFLLGSFWFAVRALRKAV